MPLASLFLSLDSEVQEVHLLAPSSGHHSSLVINLLRWKFNHLKLSISQLLSPPWALESSTSLPTAVPWFLSASYSKWSNVHILSPFPRLHPLTQLLYSIPSSYVYPSFKNSPATITMASAQLSHVQVSFLSIHSHKDSSFFNLSIYCSEYIRGSLWLLPASHSHFWLYLHLCYSLQLKKPIQYNLHNSWSSLQFKLLYYLYLTLSAK